jgi:hypothetical protein
MNTEQLCEVLAQSFEERKRDNGEAFVTCTDNAPEWVREAARNAHGDMLPDDTKYRMIRQCAERLSDYADEDSAIDSLRDQLGEIADNLVDVYNVDRVRWLASDWRRAFYIDNAQEEGLIANDADTFTRLGIGQYSEYYEILGFLLFAVEGQLD